MCDKTGWIMVENKRLKLPVGIHTFEKLRTGGYVYVDKTKYLVEEAYRQIIEKQYAKPFPGAICLGLGIDDAERQIQGGHNND